jgi:hypothetical protein
MGFSLELLSSLVRDGKLALDLVYFGFDQLGAWANAVESEGKSRSDNLESW